jgi:hypothetical protein
MALKLKQQPRPQIATQELANDKITYQYNPIFTGIPNPPHGMPQGMPVYSHVQMNPIKFPSPAPLEMPESNLPRALNYYADYGGCGFWRMIWPEFMLNQYQKACISGLTCMVMDIRFYQGLKAVRMQRQATPMQRDFIKELKKASAQLDFKLIYEVDDIVFKDDIPDYNRCKDAFCDQNIIDSILDIMGMMDEITVTCPYMKQYYQEKTGNKRITVIPNYPPKFWLDRFYDKQKIEKLYDQNKKRPRILYSGSGTHVDILNRTGLKDDFKHVTDAIIKARKKFKFVWKGCFPLVLKPYIDNGDMEFIDWSPLPNYPQGLVDTNCNAVFAPLIDNVFNKSKSNIKMVEAGGLGMPGTYQDMVTYEDSELKFKNGDDLIQQLEYITSDFDRYMDLSGKAREFTDKLWLDDHINEYEALYSTAWGSPERKKLAPRLIELNPDQDSA